MASIPDPPGRGETSAGPESGGAYAVETVIREGWGGTIRAGRYLRSGRRVTIEDIRPDLAASAALVERLGQLGRQAAGVHDPHLLSVYDLVETDGVLRLVAEWSDAPTLAAVLRRRSLPHQRAVQVVDDVLAGLTTLHNAGLHHGQVGPDTIVIEDEGRARLAELAVCAAASAPGAGADTDVRDAARLGLHLLRGGGGRLEAVRRPLQAATTGADVDAGAVRAAVAAGAAVAFGSSWREHGHAPARPRRRRRVLVAIAAIVVVAAAAAATAVVLLQPAHTVAVAPGPLVIGKGVALTVTPATGGCNTTFAFVARGPLSGAGTMVYRWEQSDGQVTDDVSLRIMPSEGAFALAEAWRLQGSQKVTGTMTFHLLKPADRTISRSFTYSCT